MINICVVCNKEFEAIKSTKKYCCRTCQNKATWMRKKEKQQLLEQGLNPNLKKCLICEEEFEPKDKNANQRLCCYNCMPDGVQLSRSKFIDLLRQKRGGKCERCGYSTYLGALDFHHLNPSEKDFTVGNRDFKLKDCIEESKKCVMLCSNCHREIHANIWNINEILEERDS